METLGSRAESDRQARELLEAVALILALSRKSRERAFAEGQGEDAWAYFAAELARVSNSEFAVIGATCALAEQWRTIWNLASTQRDMRAVMAELDARKGEINARCNRDA